MSQLRTIAQNQSYRRSRERYLLNKLISSPRFDTICPWHGYWVDDSSHKRGTLVVFCTSIWCRLMKIFNPPPPLPARHARYSSRVYNFSFVIRDQFDIIPHSIVHSFSVESSDTNRTTSGTTVSWKMDQWRARISKIGGNCAKGRRRGQSDDKNRDCDTFRRGTRTYVTRFHSRFPFILDEDLTCR